MIRQAKPSQSLLRRAGSLYVTACDADVEALKPGNVSINSPGHDMTAADFRASARATAEILVDSRLHLGERVYQSVKATRAVVDCNTNLGVLLLCAPMMQAMLSVGSTLRLRVLNVLDGLEPRDSERMYAAIRLAAPGGLGTCDQHDVAEPPSCSLMEAMRVAASRDRVAHQYAYGYADVFGYAVPLLRSLRRRWPQGTWSLTVLFLMLLARFPDTHIARKQGAAVAGSVSRAANRLTAHIIQSGPTAKAVEQVRAMDQELKSQRVNPGTTADLVVASVLALHLEELLDSEREGDDSPTKIEWSAKRLQRSVCINYPTTEEKRDDDHQSSYDR